MKNKFLWSLFPVLFLLTTGLFLMDISPVHAVYKYTPMENIPGFEGVTDFPAYVLSITKFVIWAVGITALFMITVGGFMYMTSAGNTSRMDSAKKVIFDALIGLIVVLGAWLLLYVINPDLVKVNISFIPMGAPGGPVTTPPTAPTVPIEGTASNNDAVAKLAAAGIYVTSTGNCSDQNNRACTSLDGIPASTIDNLIKLKQGSGCSFNVTGGTEVGHASHGPGKSIVDVTETSCLRSALNSSNRSSYNIVAICTTATNIDLRYNCGDYVEARPCFHLQFSS